VIGAGSWGTAVAVLLARGGVDVQLGTRLNEKADEIERRRENEAYLPGVQLPEGVTVRRAADIELAGCDLIVLAVPSKAMPQAVGTYADRIGSRAAVLLLSKGLIQPLGLLPTEYVSERVRARAIACLGGPAHAREAAAGMAALVLGSADEDLRVQLGEVFDRAGLVCERTDDVTGVEMAGVAKNAAALAAAAAEPHGMNAAGIAAAGIWDECIDYALPRAGGSRRLPVSRASATSPPRSSPPTAATAAPGSCSARACRPIRSRAGSGRRRRAWTQCR
jgi:glycerol-3-phosphate dehydrogenase (NAD(P)+)